MTEPMTYTAVLAYETPAELPPFAPDSPLVVTVEPPAVYVRSGGVWVPVASVEGNIPTPTVVPATEDAAGIAEIATQEETNAGADTFRIVTPSRLAGRTATEGRSGVVELATAAETAAGTDEARAVHPAGMKAAMTPEAWIAPTLTNGWVNHPSFDSAGYRKDPLGRVQMKGVVRLGTTGATAFTLPVGYRPPANKIFGIIRGGNLAGRMDVLQTGEVQLTVGADNSFASLEGIVFSV